MSKRTQGNAYRVNTLRLLARVGYASTRQVARAVWWRCDESTRQMAGRTLRWLLERGYIVTRRDGDSINGEQLSAVTAAGAKWLAERGEPLPWGKAHARDWLRHAHSHRTACNSVYASMCGLFPDTSAWSELEVRAGLAPVYEFTYSFEGVATTKVPDLVMDDESGMEWVEVENTWRSDKDIKKMVACMRAMFRSSSQARRIECVHFVITAPGAKSIGERLKRALTHGSESGWPLEVQELDARILSAHIKVSTLGAETLTLTPIIERKTIQADPADAFLEWRPHPEEKDVFVANYGEHFARVWEDGLGWCAEVDGIVFSNCENNISEAKRLCASNIAVMLT